MAALAHSVKRWIRIVSSLLWIEGYQFMVEIKKNKKNSHHLRTKQKKGPIPTLLPWHHHYLILFPRYKAAQHEEIAGHSPSPPRSTARTSNG
jgi:hypothetical protein